MSNVKLSLNDPLVRILKLLHRKCRSVRVR